jgi:hypothetical protein
MKVFHIEGKELKAMSEPYTFLNGDVYVVHAPEKEKVYVWLGAKSCVDEKGVGAWGAKMLDFKDPDLDIDTEVEGQESSHFKETVNFTVVEGDTPGFLKHVEVNAEDIDYSMYQVYDADIADGSSTDDIVIKNVDMNRSSLKSGDVFVLDAYHSLFVWIGKESQVGEKAAGNRLARMFDVDRDRSPMIYAIKEGSEPPEFFKLIKDLASSSDIRKDAAKMQAEMTDVIGVAERTAPPPTEHVRASNIIKLYYNNEARDFSDQPQAVLELDIANSKATLSFTAEAGLIARRTAERQARGICKTGYQLSDGARVGTMFEMVVSTETAIDQRLLQQGHHYR